MSARCSPRTTGIASHSDNNPSPTTLPHATPGGPGHCFPDGFNLFHDFTHPSVGFWPIVSVFTDIPFLLSNVFVSKRVRFTFAVHSPILFPLLELEAHSLRLPLVYQALYSSSRSLR